MIFGSYIVQSLRVYRAYNQVFRSPFGIHVSIRFGQGAHDIHNISSITHSDRCSIFRYSKSRWHFGYNASFRLRQLYYMLSWKNFLWSDNIPMNCKNMFFSLALLACDSILLRWPPGDIVCHHISFKDQNTPEKTLPSVINLNTETCAPRSALFVFLFDILKIIS